jgi:hypothetical protein
MVLLERNFRKFLPGIRTNCKPKQNRELRIHHKDRSYFLKLSAFIKGG